MSNKGYYGLNGPNQDALYQAAMIKEERRQVEEERNFQREMIDRQMGNYNSSSSKIKVNPFDHINIVNAKSLNQTATNITNIALTDEQFHQLINQVYMWLTE